MDRTITRIKSPVPLQPKVMRVAAYARVSSGKDAMLHSLSAQVSHYSSMIQNHRGWLYCGVFSDEAFTGTKENREGFQKLLAECRSGNIDLIITKSISRFARNTVTLLQTIRELKLLGVDVFFEEQNIHTLSADGEFMMTILASYAQDESYSASENQKWRIKKNFENGIPWNGVILGYRHNGEQYVVVPNEAEIVKRIYRKYLDGAGYSSIAKRLNEDGILTRRGGIWRCTGVSMILHNYTYTGNLILQKTYRENHITKCMLFNEGELPMYHAVNTHEAIISIEIYEAVQAEAARRAGNYSPSPAHRAESPFRGMIRCSGCGKSYHRRGTASRTVWICNTYRKLGKAACPSSKQIPEDVLFSVTSEVLGLDIFDEQMFNLQIKEIQADVGNTLHYIFKDGNKATVVWKDRLQSRIQTPEMKESARKRAIKNHHGKEIDLWKE